MTISILALDTSTEACSVALLYKQQVLAKSVICPQQHSQKILPMVQTILAEAQLSLLQLDAIAFSCGPGSFTGVRIGIGVVQGLAFGAELPVIPISTLATLAQGAYRLRGAMHVIPAIDARMSEVYWAQYVRIGDNQWQAIIDEKVNKPDEVILSTELNEVEWFNAGSGWQTYPYMLPFLNVKSSDYTFPLAEDMLSLALNKWQKKESQSVDMIEPIYLRNETTWNKLPGRERITDR